AAPGERHHAALGAAHAPEEEPPDTDEKEQRDDPSEEIGQPSARDFAGVLDVLRFELLGEFGILDPVGREVLRGFLAGRRLLQRAANRRVADDDFRDRAVLDESLELRIRNRPRARRQVVHLREAEQQDEGEPVPERRRRTLARRALTSTVGPAGVESRLALNGRHAFFSCYARIVSRFANSRSSPEAAIVTVSPSPKSP